MGNPFKDQFLKKGVVTKKQANKASHDQRLSGSKKGANKMPEDGGLSNKSQLDRQAQAALDKELNRQRNEAAKEKEVQGQIRQIIRQNRLEVKGDVPFHFVDGKKINRLFVSKNIVDSLSKGAMAIVKQDEQYSVVSAKAACQIRDRNPEALLLLNSPVRKELDPDDPYAEFPIPDDYEW